MRSLIQRSIIAAAVLGAGYGCTPSYNDQRPDMDRLDPRDAGMQSKDVRQAADKLAMDLLSLPELNESRSQWLVVVDRVEDRTRGQEFHGDYGIFLQALQTNLAQHGRGRIRLIENRDRFHDIRNRELEGGGASDEFGQGPAGGAGGGASGARNPDFALRATAMDLPNRGTVYYNLQFDLVDLHTREIVWARPYEVRTSR